MGRWGERRITFSPPPHLPTSPSPSSPHFTTTPPVRILRKRQAIATIFTALKC
ncbi:MAG: hypothetical protein RMY29_019215 [Nostoc sp. CreGUA01]|nr:hypothetical protein [Nostoc sp. CreGUA01]